MVKAKDTDKPQDEPGRILESNHDLIVARIRGLDDVQTIREYLEWEARHQDRGGVKELLNQRMRHVRD